MLASVTSFWTTNLLIKKKISCLFCWESNCLYDASPIQNTITRCVIIFIINDIQNRQWVNCPHAYQWVYIDGMLAKNPPKIKIVIEESRRTQEYKIWGEFTYLKKVRVGCLYSSRELSWIPWYEGNFLKERRIPRSRDLLPINGRFDCAIGSLVVVCKLFSCMDIWVGSTRIPCGTLGHWVVRKGG